MRTTSLLAALALFAAVSPHGLGAQPNALHVEAFGPALLGSINYERTVGHGFAARAGVGGIPEIFELAAELHAPVMVNYVAGRGAHRVEVGAGVVLIYVLPHSRPDEWSRTVAPGFHRPDATAALAYRWYPPRQGGTFVRVGATPRLRDRAMVDFGAGVGFAF